MRTTSRRPIDWLFPRVRREVLALLLRNPDRQWYMREIARETGMAPGSIQRELRGLTQGSVIRRSRDGNRVYYRIDERCSFYPELRGLILKTVGLVDVISECLKPLKGRIGLAVVFGSVASRQEGSASDVDLLVVGSVSSRDLPRALDKAEKILRRDVNPVLYSGSSFRLKIRQKDHFLTQVVRGPRLFVIGEENALRRLIS
jgi:predicted nucleotidyltransferase